MKIIAVLALSLITFPSLAGDVDYRPGGKSFTETWHQFYDLGDHEIELDDPLIQRGSQMVPAICSAVANKDMKYRRYALSALGFIRDPAALSCLESILKDAGEREHFRGDALVAIYAINPNLGGHYMSQYGDDSPYLRQVVELISKGAMPIGTTGLEH